MITVFHHGVDHAFPMHDDIDLIKRKIEEIVRLDHFKPFVHHRRAVDRNAAAHLPVRMGQRLLYADIRQFLPGAITKATAAGRDDQTAHRFGIISLQTLKDGTVLRIDRIEPTAMRCQCCFDQFTTADQAFLVGQRHILIVLDGTQRRMQAAKTDQRIDEEIMIH